MENLRVGRGNFRFRLTVGPEGESKLLELHPVAGGDGNFQAYGVIPVLLAVPGYLQGVKVIFVGVVWKKLQGTAGKVFFELASATPRSSRRPSNRVPFRSSNTVHP